MPNGWGLAEHARPSNSATDVLLICFSLVFLRRILRAAPRPMAASLLSPLAALYIAALAVYQGLGVCCHLWLPAPEVLGVAWFLYMSGGALALSLYGAILCLDQLPGTAGPRFAVASMVAWVVYSILLVAQLDLSNFLSLPRELKVVLPSAWAARLHWLDWMPSVLLAAGQRTAGEAPLPVRFDGRGYASVPFAQAFDPEFAARTDLMAPFPSWRFDSQPFFFLFFASPVTLSHLAIAAWGLRSTVAAATATAAECPGPGGASLEAGAMQRHWRASRFLLSHLFALLAMPTLPATMALWGVAGGIDFMHVVSIPAFYLQFTALEHAIACSHGPRPKVS